MPTNVGILTFIISKYVNTTSESFKVKNIGIFQHLDFDERLKFHAHIR